MENQMDQKIDLQGHTLFFEKRLRQTQFEHEKLKKIITSYFSVVSIVLDADDNPYLVFESLNAKGMPLTQADLIRNYFFMRIHADKQDEVYNNYWQPMQTALNDRLTEYIRHFLMKDDGSIIKQSDVYFALKGRVSPDTAIDYLKKIAKVFDLLSETDLSGIRTRGGFAEAFQKSGQNRSHYGLSTSFERL